MNLYKDNGCREIEKASALFSEQVLNSRNTLLSFFLRQHVALQSYANNI